MWITKTMDSLPHKVWWGEDANELSHAVDANTTTYKVPIRWFNPFGWVGWIHSANIGSNDACLQSEKAYFYRVGTAIHTSPIFSFKGPPAPNANRLTSFAIFGDQGTEMPLGYLVSDAMIAYHQKHRFDMVFVCGDLSYAGVDSNIGVLNITKDDEMEEIWDLWGRQNEPLSATTPLMTGVGNHEIFYNWTAFTSRYTMPRDNRGSNGNFWFSFDLGNVHILSFSTEHDYAPGSPQYKWIEQDMRRADSRRDVVPWLVVTGHRPLYSSEKDYCCCCAQCNATAGGRAKALRQALEPLILQYRVDLVVTGHLHAYERMHPHLDGRTIELPTRRLMHTGAKEEEKAGAEVEVEAEVDVYDQPMLPVHVVQGNAGGLQEERWAHPRPAWSAVRYANGNNPDTGGVSLNYSDTFGFGQVMAHNSTHLEYQYMPVSGNSSDRFWIIRASASGA